MSFHANEKDRLRRRFENLQEYSGFSIHKRIEGGATAIFCPFFNRFSAFCAVLGGSAEMGDFCEIDSSILLAFGRRFLLYLRVAQCSRTIDIVRRQTPKNALKMPVFGANKGSKLRRTMFFAGGKFTDEPHG